MDHKKISHYEIEERLGAGGMGVVYRARDPRLDRPVAIKFLSAALSADATAKQRFVQEAKAASALDHPNICSIYEIDEDEDGRLFIVMAHYEGRTVDDILGAGPVPVTEALAIMTQVADGLAKAHGRGILHRDIKPANVMLTADGIAKILDFGLAKVVGATAVTQAGHSVGTPAYMAPEQMRGEEVDARADVWSLGVMLYELVAGWRPFPGDRAEAVMYAVVHQPAKPIGGLPPDLEAIIDRCLQKDPAQRYTSAAALRDDLRQLLHELQAETPTGSVSQTALATAVGAAMRLEKERPRMSARARRRIALLVAGVAIAAAGVWGGLRVLAPGPAEAQRVLVMAPEVDASADSLTAALVASNVEVALTRGLVAMKGIVPVQAAGLPGTSPVDLAGAAAADEVLLVSITDDGREWQITMRRIDGGDGTTIWATNLSAPHDAPVLLANATLARLAQAYPDNATGDLSLEIAPDDYSTFLRQYRAGMGGTPEPAMLDSLAVVREHAPGFIDTYLLESWMARNLYERTRSPEMLRRARSVTRAAMDLAPDDTRPYQRLFDLEFYAGDLDAAEAATASLETIDPTSVEVLRQRAKIAQRRGDASRARELLQRVVERRPARRYLQDLIELEYAQAWNDDARRHLNEMLERFPGDNYARSKLAQIELLYGSAKRAKVLYEELLEDSRDVVKLTNLGLACELLGEYPSAAAWFREAAASTPDDATAVINLADCEKMSGNTERADSLYEAVLRLIAADSNPDDLYNLQMRAQALAHLGRDREAVAVVQEALGRDPGNAWTLYAAGLVYTLIGDRVSATVSIEKAAEKGVDGRWFQLALFAAVQNEPAVQAIMSSDPIRGETP